MELNNGIISLVFSDNNGSLHQITDLRSGRNFLPDPTGNRLFRLIVPTPEYSSRPVYSHKNPGPEMDKNGDNLSISFRNLTSDGESTGVSTKVNVKLPAGSAEALFSIEVVNNGSLMVDEVHGPWIGGWTGLAGKGKDSMTIGGWTLDPHKGFPTHRVHTFARKNMQRYYGGAFFLPFADISGGGEGLSYCIYTKTPRICGLKVDDLTNDYDSTCLSWMFVANAYIKPGESWKSPEVGVAVHNGDWHQTVDRYRDFLKTWWKPAPVPEKCLNQ